MKSFLFSIIAVSLFFQAGKAQSKFPYDSIPGALRIGADMVVRSRQEKVNLINDRKAIIETKVAYTLLNERAAGYNYIDIPYNKLVKVSRINASIYDENGKLVWVLKSYEIYDINGFTGPQYLDDSRSKIFIFPSYNYPYTIEYSYQYETENLLLNPDNHFCPGAKTSVEKSGIQYIIPRKMQFRYKTNNMKSPTDSVWIKNKLILTWQEENIQAKRQKPYAPPVVREMPALYTAIEDFSIGGYTGKLSSWKSFGDWYNKICDGRDILSSEYADKAVALVKNAPSTREKVRILYEYMQSKTRYFNLSFGIGGYQPIPAEQVAKNGYGDCKALSNYMKALLKAAGIESYITLIYAGQVEDIIFDFPGSQFNHAILCVPDNKDTIWLECTDQANPFAYLGSYTDDRHALVIRPDGGKIQRTPLYDKNINVVNTFSDVLLYGSGDADINIKCYQSGIEYENIKGISDSREDDRKEALAGWLDNKAFDIKKEEYSFGKTHVPFGIAKYDIHIRDISSQGTKRLFISPVLLSKFKYIWNDPAEIKLSRSGQRNDTVRITIPLGYKIEYLPEDFQVDSRFGKYSSHVSGDSKYVYFTRNYEINKAVYPKENYPEFYQFINQIAENDHKMLILKAVNN